MIDWLRPDDFDFNEAPLNQWYHAATAIVSYLVLIRWIERRALERGVSAKTMDLVRRVQAVHNLALCLASLAMVLLMSYTIVLYDLRFFPNDPDTDTDYLICPTSPTPHQGRIGYVVYLFYASKYWELLDTIIQMVKGRRPPSYNFHVWHHTCYLAICWAYMKYRSSLSALAVIVNGSVHVVMYYYYYLQVRGKPVHWKHWITRIQIIQFIAGYVFFLTTVKRIYWDLQDCNGKLVLFIHAGFNMTMLVGFVQILLRIKREQKQVNKKLQ
ncbi:GNS1/SUR4 family protein [Gregarina niphandrodes]|uniref:Elongation of fatty acids protein n=1 Tax=Gregarina niphandrodes TaxID=110365 RepID=A0A023BCE4_GRENI|nr:GNS1/SUR4 family protein [Gregarina niphandrodes]EZG83730.1 GNS1/SUR4 family protein [Gregarina niphandrodes]|eukprot:XP_011128918.1 GNS1/SUR4 family protein [Gregarina niphandrodes]